MTFRRSSVILFLISITCMSSFETPESATVHEKEMHEEFQRRRFLYRFLYENTTPDAQGKRIRVVHALNALFRDALPHLIAAGLEPKMRHTPYTKLDHFPLVGSKSVLDPDTHASYLETLANTMQGYGWLHIAMPTAHGKALNAEGKTVYTVELLIDPNSIDAPPAAPVALPLDERDVLEPQDISPETLTKAKRILLAEVKMVGGVRLVLNPEEILRQRLGQNPDPEVVIDALIADGFADWKEYKTPSGSVERFTLLESEGK